MSGSVTAATTEAGNRAYAASRLAALSISSTIAAQTPQLTAAQRAVGAEVRRKKLAVNVDARNNITVISKVDSYEVARRVYQVGGRRLG
jgi:hypothetical protein